jgi:hypothetical protein
MSTRSAGIAPLLCTVATTGGTPALTPSKQQFSTDPLSSTVEAVTLYCAAPTLEETLGPAKGPGPVDGTATISNQVENHEMVRMMRVLFVSSSLVRWPAGLNKGQRTTAELQSEFCYTMALC